MDSDLRSQRGGLRGFSINRLIPNILTLAALCAGLTGIRFALQGEMRLAVIAIIVAAIFDALDGRVARRLGVTSRFGAELDSLSDFLCFGVAPALVLYLASLSQAGALGWVVTLMFPICSALRLARFNTALVSDTPPPVWTGSYFTGVPAPAGALLALMPLMMSFEIEAAWPRHATVVGVVLVVVLAPLVEHPGGVLLGAALGVAPSARALDPPHGLAVGAAGADEDGWRGRGAHGDGLLGVRVAVASPSTFSCREGTNVPLGRADRSARDRGIPD